MEHTSEFSGEYLDKLLSEKGTNNIRHGYTTVKKFTLPKRYLEFQKDIDEFQVYDTDTWIITYPRSGTTWASEMVWLIANNFDYEKAKIKLNERVTFLDFDFLFDNDETSKMERPKLLTDVIKTIKNQPQPRFIKTHLPFQLLPKQIQTGERHPKIVYVCRNPLDVCVSSFYHESSMCFYGDVEEYCKLFISGKMIYTPFWEHILPFWQIRNQPNILFLKYEDMKQNLTQVIQKTVDFLGISATPNDVQILQKHLSFESMKENPTFKVDSLRKYVRQYGKINSPFMRAGVTGSYKDEMPQKFVLIFEKWMKSNLEGTGLTL